jgi:hypothetical protein
MAPRHHPGWKPVLLRQRRLDAGYTQEDLAEAVANLEIPGFRPPRASREMVADHENGRHHPTSVYRRAYRHVLGLTDEQLGFRAGPPRPAGGVCSPQPGGARPDGQPLGEVDPTDRRELVGLAAAALGVSAFGAPALTSDDRLALLERAGAASGAVAAAEGLLAAVVGDYLAQPPGVVLGRVAALQQMTDAVQADYLLRPAETARLWRVAGIAAGVRGWLENNAGDTAAARSSLREAHRRGDLIDDDRLTAWARYMQAVLEDYAGDPAAAERHALDGLRRLHRAGSAGRPLRAHILLDHVAKRCADRGDLDGAAKAVTEAGDIVTALPPEQHAPANNMIFHSMDTFEPAEFAVAAGLAFARHGRPDRFEDVTAEAGQAADRAGTHLRVFFRLDEALAVGRSAEPDPERVAGLARAGLAVADPFQTAHAANRLGMVLEAAKPFETHPAIRDLAEYGAAWRTDRLTASTNDF